MQTGASAIEPTWPGLQAGAGHRIGIWGLALALLAVMLVWLAPDPARAQGPWQDGSYVGFEEALEPHGEWVDHERYGQVWTPYAGEDRSWRPYSRGQWVYTEEHGWYWESDEEFGWATYHYGRWALDDRYGWIWVPGNEWGPAWVAWRQGEEEVGWAPLPPDAFFDPYSDGATFAVYDRPSYAPLWVFVPATAILAPAIWRHAYPAARNRIYFGNTRYVTHYSRQNRQVFNRGIDPRFVERRINRPLPVARIRSVTSPGARLGRGDGRFVGVYRPQFPRGGAGPRAGFRPDDRRWAPPREARGTPGGFGVPRDDRRFGRARPETQGDFGRRNWRRDEPDNAARFERSAPPPQAPRPGFAGRPPSQRSFEGPAGGGHFGRPAPPSMQRPRTPLPTARAAPPAFRAPPPVVQRSAPPPRQRQAPPQVQRQHNSSGGAHGGGGRGNRGPSHQNNGQGGR